MPACTTRRSTTTTATASRSPTSTATACYDIYFVNQVGGNELWKNLGGGRFRNITKDAGVGLRRPDQRRRVVRRHRQRRRSGSVRDHGPRRQRAVRKRRPRPLQGHHQGGGPRSRRRTRPAPCSSTTTTTACSIFWSATSASTRPTRKGRGGAYVGLADAFLGPPASGSIRIPRPVQEPRPQPVQGRDGGRGLRPVADGAATPAVADLNGDGWPDLFVLNMQGTDHYYENAGGREFVDKTAQYFPRTPWGAMGIKFFDYDNDGRPDLFVTDMHSDMSEEVGPDTRKAEVADSSAEPFLRGPPTRYLRQRVFPQPRRRQVRGDLGSRWASRTTGRGGRASGT